MEEANIEDAEERINDEYLDVSLRFRGLFSFVMLVVFFAIMYTNLGVI